MSDFTRLVIMDESPELSKIYSAISKGNDIVAYSFIDSYNAVEHMIRRVSREHEVDSKIWNSKGFRPMIDLIIVHLVSQCEDELSISPKLRDVCPRCKIILASNLPVSDRMECAFDGVLRKPYSTEGLERIVEKITMASRAGFKRESEAPQELIAA